MHEETYQPPTRLPLLVHEHKIYMKDVITTYMPCPPLYVDTNALVKISIIQNRESFLVTHPITFSEGYPK